MDKENQIRQMIIAELANMNEEKFREIIRDELQYLIKTDKYVFSRHIVISDGRNIQVGAASANPEPAPPLPQAVGTKIGTSALQKLGFWGKTPVVQASAIAATGAKSATYVQAEAQATDTAVNALRTALTNAGITA